MTTRLDRIHIITYRAFLPRNSKVDKSHTWRKKFQQKSTLDLNKPTTELPQ